MSSTTPKLGLFKYNPLTDGKETFSIQTALNNNWDIIDKKCGGGLEVCDIGMALYVDETKGLRRYLNGQIVDINVNTQAFLNRLKEITTLYPSLLCTEDEWQTAKTMSAFGQVGKFVFNYSGDEIVSVRIPAIVNVQGLFDLQNLGMTVSAGLPNITGNANIQAGKATDWNWASNITGCFYSDTNKTLYLNNGTGAVANWLNLDASRSSDIYGNSDTVQQEAIQYPYFIQIATGAETENNIINDIELNNPYSLFDFKWADHELNNLSWLKSNDQWNSGTVYVKAYNVLLAEYNNLESVEETESGIIFKRTPKGYKIALADQETAIQSKYETHGIAWYYLLDTANTQFKLPRTKFGFEGLRDKVGNDISESLPNITGFFAGQGNRTAFQTALGVFKKDGRISGAGVAEKYDDSCDLGITFDASRSSSAYQDGAPVQERATQMYLYFYVGETVQNANLINAGRIEEIVSQIKTDKLDRGDKQEITSWVTPDYANGISVAYASGINYTCPADGVFSVQLYIGASNLGTVSVNGSVALRAHSGSSSVPTTMHGQILVSKGDVITATKPKDTASKYNSAYFYPMKGAN